jgi:hypothetical protein
MKRTIDTTDHTLNPTTELAKGPSVALGMEPLWLATASGTERK